MPDRLADRECDNCGLAEMAGNASPSCLSIYRVCGIGRMTKEVKSQGLAELTVDASLHFLKRMWGVQDWAADGGGKDSKMG